MVKDGSYMLKVGSSSQTFTLSSLVYGSSSGMAARPTAITGGRPGGRMQEANRD